jgi:putative oxidoreductase
MTGSAADLALLGVRLLLGGVMLAHGVNHIIGGGRITGTARWFESLGMRPGWLHAWVASITEVGAGLLVVAGLVTSVACAGVVGVMLVAWITNHRGNGFFIFRPGEGWEYVMTLTGIALVVAMLGPGAWSLDHVAGIGDSVDGWRGLAIAGGAGALGAAATLVGFWRPAQAQR